MYKANRSEKRKAAKLLKRLEKGTAKVTTAEAHQVLTINAANKKPGY